MKTGPKGILLINLGTPKSTGGGDMRAYLNQFLTDRRVIDLPWIRRQLLVRGMIVPFRYKASTKMYQQIWDAEKGSPLMYHSENFLDKFRAKLPQGYMAELAMRYQEPSISMALDKLRKEHISELIIFPMFPQYASASTGSAIQEVFEKMSSWLNFPAVRVINQYFDNVNYVDAVVEKIKAQKVETYDHVIFSYHSIPLKHILDADPSHCHCHQGGAQGCCDKIININQLCYRAQCVHSSKAFAEKLCLDDSRYTVTFQSRLGKAEWVKPYTVEVLKELAAAGKKKVLVASPAFTADCLETLFEIGIEYAEDFKKWGGEKLDYVESLNDSDLWVNTVLKLTTT